MFYTALVYAMLRDSHGHQGQLHFTAGFPAFLIRFKIAYDTTHYDFHWKYWPVAYTQRIFFPGLCEYQLFLKKKKVAGVTSKRKCLRARRKFNWKKRGKERNKEGLQLALTWLAPRARLGIVSVSGLHCRTWSTPATFAQQEPILLCCWHPAPWAEAELMLCWPSRDSDLPTSKEEDSCRRQPEIPKLFFTQQMSSFW